MLESSIWRSTRCFLTWKVSATPHKRLLFRLVPRTLRTDETEYVSWAGQEERAIYFIPTPRAENIPTSEKAKAESKSSPGLTDYVNLFPTPTAQDFKRRGPNSKQQGLPEVVRMWPTPRANKIGGYSRSDFSPTLEQAVKTDMFPTPTQFDATCGDLEGKEYNGQTKHAMKLIQAAKMLPTPRAFCYKDATEDRGKHNLGEVVGGKLNPEFVEWMMGFPKGYTEVD